MISVLNDWLSRLVKNLQTEPKNEIIEDIDEDEGPEPNIVAFFNLAVDDNNQLIISSDYMDGNEEAMAKLVFMLCSGSLMDVVGQIVTQRCENNPEQRDKILSTAYDMILNNLSSMQNSDDEDDPVVDPCCVFKPKNSEDDEDD